MANNRWDWNLTDGDVTIWIKLLRCPDGVAPEHLQPMIKVISGGVNLKWVYRPPGDDVIELTVKQKKALKYECVTEYTTTFVPIDDWNLGDMGG